jgi:hypothetical protein
MNPSLHTNCRSVRNAMRVKPPAQSPPPGSSFLRTLRAARDRRVLGNLSRLACAKVPAHENYTMPLSDRLVSDHG